MCSSDLFNLVADAWASVVAGRLTAVNFLGLVEQFGDEDDLAVWQAIDAGLRTCDRLVEGSARTRFASRVAALANPVLDRLGWDRRDGEGQLTSQLRGLVVQIAAIRGKDASVAAQCREIFDRWCASTEGLDPELVVAAINAVASLGEERDYSTILEHF